MATQTPELTRLMSNARVHIPGALDDTLKLELHNTLAEFLLKTKFWREQIEYTVRPGRTAYELAGTESGAIFALVANLNSNGNPVAASMATAGTLDLTNDPGTVEVLTAEVALTVVDPDASDDYPQIPDDLLVMYGEGILAGLVGRMMSQPAKPYTNERMGIFNLRKFNVSVATARAAVAHKNIHGGQAWRFPPFASGHQR